jgi:hypothetical protein
MSWFVVIALYRPGVTHRPKMGEVTDPLPNLLVFNAGLSLKNMT